MDDYLIEMAAEHGLDELLDTSLHESVSDQFIKSSDYINTVYKGDDIRLPIYYMSSNVLHDELCKISAKIITGPLYRSYINRRMKELERREHNMGAEIDPICICISPLDYAMDIAFQNLNDKSAIKRGSLHSVHVITGGIKYNIYNMDDFGNNEHSKTNKKTNGKANAQAKDIAKKFKLDSKVDAKSYAAAMDYATYTMRQNMIDSQNAMNIHNDSMNQHMMIVQNDVMMDINHANMSMMGMM